MTAALFRGELEVFAARMRERAWPDDRRGATAELDVGAWESGTSLLEFDRRVHAAEDQSRGGADPVHVRLVGDARSPIAVLAQVLTRYQRLFVRRNRASVHPTFERVLDRHAALHDRTKPLVRADHEHAIDVWQWVLRLDPSASLALQIAALFHDVERLRSEADVRIEHRARDYAAFKGEHAARGSAMLGEAVAGLGLARASVVAAEQLVARHERPEAGELAVLNDADALSFFALNAEGFLAYFGPEHTRTKVAYTLARMRPGARERLWRMRLPPEVAAMIGAWLGASVSRVAPKPRSPRGQA